jgi:hypothetical protein
MKELVYSVKVVTRDALLGHILDAADRIRNSQQKLQRVLIKDNYSGTHYSAWNKVKKGVPPPKVQYWDHFSFYFV